MTALGKLALLCFRDVRRPALLLASLRPWADLFAAVMAAPNGVAAVRAVLKYIAAACRRLPKEEIQNVMQQLTADSNEDTEGTLGDQLREYFREDGIEEGSRRVLLRQLRKRFGDLPESIAARVKAADLSAIDLWIDRMFTATTLDEVFAES